MSNKPCLACRLSSNLFSEHERKGSYFIDVALHGDVLNLNIQSLHHQSWSKLVTSKSLSEDCATLQAVDDALNAGHERFSFDDRDSVKKTLQDVRLDPEIAKEVLSSTARKAFMGFISRSRNKANKLEAAKELKALVYFSNIVVTPLLEDINVRRACKEALEKNIERLLCLCHQSETLFAKSHTPSSTYL